MVGEFLCLHQPGWRLAFQSRCRDWVVGEFCRGFADCTGLPCFSLVAEIGWLARLTRQLCNGRTTSFSLVAEIGWLARLGWVALHMPVASFSLVAEIGWLASLTWRMLSCALARFSLVAEIGWLAREGIFSGALPFHEFQSRCRDWVVGEATLPNAQTGPLRFQSRCRDWVVGE